MDMQRAYNKPRQCYAQPVMQNRRPCCPDKEHRREHEKIHASMDCDNEEHMPIGMAYVPMQKWNSLYKPCEAFCEGTAFPELNLIFCGVRGK